MTPQKSAEADSSSPGLPEISSFFRSHAQPSDPATASRIVAGLPGFTSAGTLWKAAALEAEQKDLGGRSNTTENNGTGKLVRPVKKVRNEEQDAAVNVGRTRTPSISLSEFDFKGHDNPGQMQPPKGVKKAGKRAVKPKDGDGNGKVSRVAGKAEAKDDLDVLSKAPKRAAKPALANVSKQPKDPSAKVLSEAAQAEDTTTVANRTRRLSLAISDHGYEAGQPISSEKIEKTSAYFSPATYRNTNPAKIFEACFTETVPEESTAARTSEQSALPNATVEPRVTASTHSARKASISLSEFDYRPEEHAPVAGPPAGEPNAAKKPRKRPTDAKAETRDGPAKKAKKRFAKSASIILDSDEPDPATMGDSHVVDERRSPVQRIQTSAEVPKAKKAPRKPKLKPAEVTGPSKLAALDVPAEPGFGVWSQSVYFKPAPVANTIEKGATVESLQNVFTVDGKTATTTSRSADPQADMPVSPLPVFGRRRSWTPAKNTYEVLDPEVDSSGESPVPKKSLADLVGGFGYDEQGPSRARSSAGEPLIKKRRIEASGNSDAVAAPRKAKVATEKVKRVKAPKKKPQTITDLATKAYRVEELETPNAQSTVSEFFAAHKDENLSAATAPSETGEAPPTFKKPRKPRAKKDDGESSKPKKTPKPKKVKVKFNEASLIPPLLSPQQARAKEKKQGFLFGTSSQLAVEEDVNFVRDLQMAIRESEAVGGAAAASPKRLSTKVSVGQTERGLFWTASRDSLGHVVAANDVRRKAAVAVPQPTVVVASRIGQPETVDETAGNDFSTPPFVGETRQTEDNTLHQPDDCPVVDLCDTSPAAAAEDEEHMPVAAELPLLSEPADRLDVEPEAPTPTAPGLDDSWMLLETDSSEDEDQSKTTSAISLPALTIARLPPTRLPATQPFPTSTSLMRGKTHPRTALTTLDSNMTILAQTSPANQQRAFASETSPGALKRPRGRPPKTATSTSAAALSPKRRERPLKPLNPAQIDADVQRAYSASQPPLSSEFIAIEDISDSASEDRPLKEVLAMQSAPASPKRRGRPPKPPQPSSTPKSSFVNIDDISDSDAGKKTPSPRRRKAGGTASQPVQTLELSPSVHVALPVIDGKAAIKPTDPCWLELSKLLFPRITAEIKSTPPSREEAGDLSWWEKILMYDPIVLEDLTAWLIGTGIGVAVRRRVFKEKKKCRKKKGKVQEEVLEEECEVVKEELKGWMVQKWCEEKSICCLWREGLRGGVKVRY